MKILVLNGPNINLLGKRNKKIYGNDSYQDLLSLIFAYGKSHNIFIDEFQSNHEGVLIDKLQSASEFYDGVIFNPAAYTHTSIALFDTIMAIDIDVVEVHLSDVDNREQFRKVNYIRPACIDSVSNMGIKGYIEAVKILEKSLKWLLQ